ncbi:MAG TPA: sulfatase-like hydrolase/transferase [Candidatus Hydrogenedentes bacterium]|nr:sulfatase-like hydrolase/transferase [Candidatus Hydrogenedentota bacterium]HOV73165.1 sulfatase-like hydrolase/transferase [Candidatus Hydrogenedentota bacterium]HPC16803.1 sulfatase-like hydrolase/transferase [Candidatus Hydrogenedentota bacterium]HRT18522.1 sulfatase-like hydrolase/transferase [Candidatus Hydrogenedentota bacterium]HRT63541.1 sulfatase-like hydrolase/transferase [Candidatus Hydrogenedentota bacterium]
MATMQRRAFLGAAAAAATALAAEAKTSPKGGTVSMTKKRRPNVLFVMTDQQRADTIAALGNPHIYTPNFDRLVARGVTFTNAYSECPVCVPARMTVYTGCTGATTGLYGNAAPDLVEGQPPDMEDRCGAYLPRTMARLGYRTFGIGKFHTHPWDADLGFEVHLHSEELYGSPDQRRRDSYAAFIRTEHPAYDFIEGLMGERTEMYYMPQMSPIPAEFGVEAWAADRAVEQIAMKDDRPYFGYVSFIGPHPPLAPPIPFNRMYDPDRMPNPVRGDKTVDFMDEQIRWMNHAIWAEDINDAHARVLKARYYGEISYIDQCLGRILDAVEARGDAENTLICFYSDHGDHLGDHGAWQKESYFEAACHVPFLLSWPECLPAGERNAALAGLADLFGIATSAAGKRELREGADILAVAQGKKRAREHFIGMYGSPGSPLFKIMVRQGDWKYIYMANGGKQQLFNLQADPDELHERSKEEPARVERMRQMAIHALDHPNAGRALHHGDFLALPESNRPLRRIYQFDGSRGIKGFPVHPGDVLRKS